MRSYFIPTRMLLSKSQIITNVGKDVERWEPSSAAGGVVDWCSHFEKWSYTSSKG